MNSVDNSITTVNVDVLVIGGGIAGLWTLARLHQAGYKSILLEAEALGAGQTRYAQGIIHGGTKYALTGKLTALSAAVASMPTRWRACHEGTGELDLTRAELLSDAHYLWSTRRLTSRLSGFFASKVMHSRSTEVKKSALPSLFQHKAFNGQLYQLDEPVFNTLSVIRAIAEPLKDYILPVKTDSLQHDNDSVVVTSQGGENYRFHYQSVLLMAGEGNENLLSRFDYNTPQMQRRPLKMVIVRGGLTDRVYAHCLGASVNPRITITSHFDADGNIVWYLGGQLAEDGVHKSNTDLICTAKKELAELIPWLDLKQSQWGVLEINRAEIKKAGSTRPDSFSIEQSDNIITAWPTKLALAPALADALIEQIQQQVKKTTAAFSVPNWESVTYADFPWNEADVWMKNV